MASRTASGLAGGMARGDHIHHENYGVIGANGSAPAFITSHSLDLHLGNLSSMACGGHTLRTALRGCIPEFTDPEGLVPSLIASCGQVSHPRNQRTTAHGELVRGMALTGHILLGNHTVNHTKGPRSSPPWATAQTSTSGI